MPFAARAQQVSATIINVVDVKCFGDCNGSATASISGGTSPYTYTWTSGQKTLTASGLCAGSYTFTVRDAGGDTYSVGVAINSPTQLNLPTSSSSATCGSCPNGSASATGSGGTPGYSYSWSNGTTLQTATGLIPGTYTVCITDKNGCTKCTSVTVNTSTGIQKSEKAKLSVSPNPTSNLIYMELENGKWKVEIINMLGEKIYSSVLEANASSPVSIDISRLPAGVYLVSANGTRSYTARIVKE